MKYDVKNRTSGVRSFPAAGRYLTLAGGESERGVELTKEEADALKATNEFHVTEREPVKVAAEEPKPAARPAPEPANKAT